MKTPYLNIALAAMVVVLSGYSASLNSRIMDLELRKHEWRETDLVRASQRVTDASRIDRNHKGVNTLSDHLDALGDALGALNGTLAGHAERLENLEKDMGYAREAITKTVENVTRDIKLIQRDIDNLYDGRARKHSF